VSKRAIIILVALLAGIGLFAWAMVSGSGVTVTVGDTLATRPLPLLTEENEDAAGPEELTSPADFRGRWVLLNFWASWCEPCKEEAPLLQKFHDEHSGDDFTVLGVDTLDNSFDGLDFEKRHNITFPSIHDGSGEYHKELGMTGVPESVLLDPEGRVALYRPGPVTEEYLQDFVLPVIRGELG